VIDALLSDILIPVPFGPCLDVFPMLLNHQRNSSRPTPCGTTMVDAVEVSTIPSARRQRWWGGWALDSDEDVLAETICDDAMRNRQGREDNSAE